MAQQLSPAFEHRFGHHPAFGYHGVVGRAPATTRVLCTARPTTELRAAWDHLVGAQPGSDVTQLSAWANLRAEHAGFRPRYVFATRAGRLVGGAQVLARRIPVIGTVGYLPYGPVVAAGEPRRAVVHAVAGVLHDLARHELSALFVQPPAGAHDVTAVLTDLGFRTSVAGIAPAASIRLDLARDVEALRRGLTRSNRRRTRSAAQRGITVRIGVEGDLPTVADLLASTAAHHQFDPAPLEYLRTMYRELRPGGQIVVFLAELDGEPVAAEVFTGCGGVLKSRLTGMRRCERVRRAGVSAVLVWHAAVWAKAAGYRALDFGGVDPAADDELAAADALTAGAMSQLSGPAAFKASFGGAVLRYPRAVELVSSPLLRRGYDLARCSRFGHPVVVAARRFLRGGAVTDRGAQSGSSSR